MTNKILQVLPKRTPLHDNHHHNDRLWSHLSKDFWRADVHNCVRLGQKNFYIWFGFWSQVISSNKNISRLECLCLWCSWTMLERPWLMASSTPTAGFAAGPCITTATTIITINIVIIIIITITNSPSSPSWSLWWNLLCKMVSCEALGVRETTRGKLEEGRWTKKTRE